MALPARNRLFIKPNSRLTLFPSTWLPPDTVRVRSSLSSSFSFLLIALVKSGKVTETKLVVFGLDSFVIYFILRVLFLKYATDLNHSAREGAKDRILTRRAASALNQFSIGRLWN